MLNLQDILNSDNILDLLQEDAILDIAEQVFQGYQDDLMSRGEWNQRIEKWTRLAAQVQEVKNTPWPNASNVKYPLVTEACIQFSSRMYPAIVQGTSPAKGRVIGYDPQGQKLERATRLSKHISYQLLEQMTEWEEMHDRMSMIVGLAGSAFKKSYYCPIKRRNVSELVLPQNFVVNYYTKDLESCRRYSHETEIHGNEIVSMQRMGLYSDVDLRTPEQKQDTVKNEVHGLSAPRVDSTTPYNCIEQHMYLDLDEDGYQEPYIATLDVNSKALLRLVPCYDEAGISYNFDGEVQDIQKDQYFTKYGLLPSPDGSFYDYGFGQYVGPVNEAVDTLFNQLIDAGTLSNMGGGFISKGIRLKGGAQRRRIGEWLPVNATGDDLRKGIFPNPIKEPSPTLLNLATFLINAGQRLAGTIDSMVGENPGQNQKATTTMAVMDQGQKVFSGIYKRFLRSFKQELKVIYNLNKKYLEPQEYFTVLDTDLPAEVLLQDYQNEDLDVVPSADPSFTNEQQKLQKAAIQLEMAQMGLIPLEVAKAAMIDAHELPNKEQLMQPMPRVPSLDEQKFEDESMREWTKVKIDTMLKISQTGALNAKAFRDVAEAEAVEPGRQAGIYKMILDELNRDIDREIDREAGQQEANSGTGGAETPEAGAT